LLRARVIWRTMTAMRHIGLAVLAFLLAIPAFPCGFDTTPQLIFDVRPDAPIERYVSGRLGILRPEFARSHLVVAWRHLTGHPPSAEERRGFVELLRHRLRDEDVEPPPNAAVEWENARAKARGVEPRYGLTVWRQGENYDAPVNCADHAFQTAIATLHARIKTYGLKHPGVQNWITAQEVVFANCHDGVAQPAPPEPSLPPILRADREYQIAAADFYATRYDEARAKMLAIARDADSPWRYARIVAARALIRKSGVAYDGAQRDLEAIVADPAFRDVHEAARDLIAFTRYRIDPTGRLAETAKALAEGEPLARRARRDLADYTYLLDREISTDDAMTDWILTFQDGKRLPHAIERWRATKSLHWLVAAMTHLQENDPELMRAAAEVPQSSPAYVSLAYHRARLLLAQKKRNGAREVLDTVMSMELPPSSLNAFREQRRPLAQSLDEYLRDLPGIPVGDDTTKIAPYPQTEPVLPGDVAKTINVLMPHHVLVEAALKERVPPSIRKQLVVAAYVRASLLRNEEWQNRLAPDLKKFFGITPRNTLDLLLDYPFLQPYVVPLDSRIYNATDDPHEVIHAWYENWWCADGNSGLSRYAYPGDPVVPQFLGTAEMRRVARKDRDALLAHGSGATYLLRNAMARAKNGHPRAAESLSRAVLGTRWSCEDEKTTNLARQAFTLLHRRYGKTKWAQQTKYWYQGFSY
jgi:hypothetical protein